jgi:hypothetical protein
MRNESSVDLQDVETAAQFVAAMRQLKALAGFGYRQLEDRARRAGLVLPHSTLSAVLARNALPRPDLVEAFVRACGGDDAGVERWLRVRSRIAVRAITAPHPYPADAADPGPATEPTADARPATEPAADVEPADVEPAADCGPAADIEPATDSTPTAGAAAATDHGIRDRPDPRDAAATPERDAPATPVRPTGRFLRGWRPVRVGASAVAVVLLASVGVAAAASGDRAGLTGPGDAGRMVHPVAGQRSPGTGRAGAGHTPSAGVTPSAARSAPSSAPAGPTDGWRLIRPARGFRSNLCLGLRESHKRLIVVQTTCSTSLEMQFRVERLPSSTVRVRPRSARMGANSCVSLNDVGSNVGAFLADCGDTRTVQVFVLERTRRTAGTGSLYRLRVVAHPARCLAQSSDAVNAQVVEVECTGSATQEFAVVDPVTLASPSAPASSAARTTRAGDLGRLLPPQRQ